MSSHVIRLCCGCEINAANDDNESSVILCTFHSRSDSTANEPQIKDGLEMSTSHERKQSVGLLRYVRRLGANHAIWLTILAAIAMMVIANVDAHPSLP